MPIVFVHGVNVRQDEAYAAHVAQRDRNIKELVMGRVVANPNRVRVFNPYWGQFGAELAWGGASLPSGRVQALDPFPDAGPDQAVVELLLSGNDTPLPETQGRTLVAIANSSLLDAMDLLFALAAQRAAAAEDDDALAEVVRLSARVYEYAEQYYSAGRYRKPPWLAAVGNDQEFVAQLQGAVDQFQAPPPPSTLGLFDGWDAVHEGVDRFGQLAANLASRALLLMTRKPLNMAVSHFIGDVFVYLKKRGQPEAPGAIVGEIANGLDQAVAAIHPSRDPHLIVIAHSMGGNIVYDLLTHFYPDTYPVDLLVTVGSQVALFEELKLYGASRREIPVDPREERVNKPGGVQHWLNVYDPNDVLSYAAAGVFAGATDFVYSTGKGVLSAHTAYFLRGSFFRRLALRMEELLKAG
ncbi:MAG: hypothetical protein H6641_19345 [Caldilineaceae bacterium]|nr:hypothetical protein [Caldilineaceae bacterium]